MSRTITWSACMSAVAAGWLLMCGLTAHAEDDEESRYAPTPPVLYPGGVKSLRDVTYAELSGFRPLTLDLYLPPEGGAPKPAVIFVHGGAWRHRTARDGGTFRDFPAVLASVAARGYVVASVNYRLLGEAKFPGPVQDLAMSIRWLRANAEKYGIDPTKFAAWGSSAGGQLAALIGTACDSPLVAPPSKDASAIRPRSACVQGVIDWYGLIDPAGNAADLGLTGPSAQKRESAYLGCELPDCPADIIKSANAISFVDANDPPFLIQHGNADTSVSVKQSQRLHEALRAAGVDSKLILYPNVDHGFAKPKGGPDDAVNKQAMQDVFEFLARLFSSSLPKPDGKYPVGMRRFELKDPSRRGVVSQDPNEPRVLPGYVWYPASNGVNGTRPYMTSAEVLDQGRAMARNFGYRAMELDGLSSVVAHSVEGATVARGHNFPILIFNHGYECYAAQNTALSEQLASHGYIVFSIAHPHDAADLRLSDGTLLKTSHPAGQDPTYASLRKTMTSGADHDARTAALQGYADALSHDRLGASLAAWRDDILFTARAIEKRTVPESLLSIVAAGDGQRLGFVGMSFGGASAASTCRLVPECRAAINFDGGNYEAALFNASVQRPLLLMMSDWVNLPLPGRASDAAFHHNDYAYEPWVRSGLDANVIRLRLEGIRHMGFTDLMLLMPGSEHEARFGTIEPHLATNVIAAASLAFLDEHLKQGNPEALNQLVQQTPVLHRHSPSSVREWALARESRAGS